MIFVFHIKFTGWCCSTIIFTFWLPTETIFGIYFYSRISVNNIYQTCLFLQISDCSVQKEVYKNLAPIDGKQPSFLRKFLHITTRLKKKVQKSQILCKMSKVKMDPLIHPISNVSEYWHWPEYVPWTSSSHWMEKTGISFIVLFASQKTQKNFMPILYIDEFHFKCLKTMDIEVTFSVARL